MTWSATSPDGGPDGTGRDGSGPDGHGETGPDAGRPQRHLVVDGANVVGSRPDGWWRDRAGAAERLAAQLVAALDGGALDGLPTGGGPADRGAAVDVLHLVLEGQARSARMPAHPGLRVVRAEADGDGAIVELVGSLAGAVTVVTADRGLRARLAVPVVGPGALLARL